MKTSLIIIVATIVLVGAYLAFGFYEPETDLKDMGPLDYEVDETLVDVTMGGELFEVDEAYFESLAAECGNLPTDEHLAQLSNEFSGIQKYDYKFEYIPENQGQSSFNVSVLPNKLGYANLEEFKTDFELCYAGGKMNPASLTDEWLMFVNSCGTGFSDGSGLPVGCNEARSLVEPTLEL